MRTLPLCFTAAAIISTVIAASSSTHASGAAMPAGNVAHGQYLAEHVAMCIECHSPRDESGRILAGHEYTGGPLPFKVPVGWAMLAPRNRGLLGYDDEQAIRLLTAGAIDRHGEQLRPPMPRFRMTQQDAADVIAFLRSLH